VRTEWPGLEKLWLGRFQDAVDRLGRGISARDLLLERARIEGRVHAGAISTGGACRLLPAADGHIAVNLPRASDIELVPAWLMCDEPFSWDAVATAVSIRTVADLVERAALCDLPVAVPGGPATSDEQLSARCQTPIPEPTIRAQGGRSDCAGALRVVDLSAMWAGPLCGALLADGGAKVAKIESPDRPDPRTSAFHERLNGAKECLELPLGSPGGTAALRDLLAAADVVIESSRPRVMAQWGIDPAEFADEGGVWVSITAYGRTGPWANRPGFGDDTAVAGGLWFEQQFVGDAAGDPITGVFAALGVLDALETGRGALVDVAMRETVAHVVGDDPFDPL
jgi:hypothetical protein